MKNLIKKIIPNFLLDWYHFILPMIGAFLYGFPSKKIKVIGVAGTDGKTTTTGLIVGILEQAGYKTAAVSSIRFKIGAKEWKNTLKMTMPGRFKLQRFLRDAVRAGCQYAVLETTDEGIKQHRHRFIDFKTAVLTNITPEHIEAHGSFEKMRAENEKLFQIAKETHIINLDDENRLFFLKYLAEKKYGYGLKVTTFSDDIKVIKTKDCQTLSSGIKFSVEGIKISLKLLGEFNISNALAAICFGLSEGISLKDCQKALEKVEVVPGRMEIVIGKPTVIVDYAHTTAALEKVYQAIQKTRDKTQKTKMICVFGSCGGGRDRWKRPEFGKIAAHYCDEIILTNEDPYDEDPSQILSEIKSGIVELDPTIGGSDPFLAVYEILDRRKAIKKALVLAKPDDVVIITGKGSEPWMCVAEGKKNPWDDRKIVREEFEKLSQ